MSDYTPTKNKKTSSKDSPETAAILKKMQYQLDSMERKLDSLLKQSSPRDFKSSYPSKPRREYDNTKRPFNQKHTKRSEGSRSEGKFYYGLQSGAKRNPSKGNFSTKKRSSKR